MKVLSIFLTALMLLSIGITASAQPLVIPANTVVPVTLDTPLSSATARVGDLFYAHSTGTYNAGFPQNTRFTGRVDSVTRATSDMPGQLGVSFIGARLPDGTPVPLYGKLASLDQSSVRVDPNTGRLIGTGSSRRANSKFIAIGAGAGLIIGQLLNKNAVLGAILGAAAGYFYGQSRAVPAVGKDVTVPYGTQFGVLLNRDVSIPSAVSSLPSPYPGSIPGSVGAGPGYVPAYQVRYGSHMRPVSVGNEVLVPFRYTMGQINMPFSYESYTRTIRTNMSNGSQAVHVVGSNVVYINGQPYQLAASSRIVNGSVYVPSSYISEITGRTVNWNSSTGVLQIQ